MPLYLSTGNDEETANCKKREQKDPPVAWFIKSIAVLDQKLHFLETERDEWNKRYRFNRVRYDRLQLSLSIRHGLLRGFGTSHSIEFNKKRTQN